MYGLDIDESAGINVLEALKATNLSCDLHIFVNSTYDTEDNYKALIHDLTQYCSNSESTKVYQVLCRIIFIELEIGCSLLNRSRPLPIKYITSETSTKLCSKNKIIHIDRWIWKKLKLNKKEQMGSDLTKLCTNITSSNETIRLARFFYEIAPSIKRIDSYSSNSISHKILESSTIDRVNLKKREYAKNSDETDQDKIGHENQLLNKNTNDEFQSVKTNSNENLEGNKTEVVLDLKQEQSDSNINKTNSSENDLEQDQETESKLENERKKTRRNVRHQLGLDKEASEREKVNERPKPKPLDVETAFKPKDDEQGNWLEGSNTENKQENEADINSNSLHLVKHRENQLNVPVGPKKKLKLRARTNLNRDGDDNSSKRFMTSFLAFTLCIIVSYLIITNRNKLLGLLVEGYRRRYAKHGRHFGSNFGPMRLPRLSQTS
ncbi:unnamed protein product [Rotaria magnacalcarata]|uniref:Uncharacterized protein n=1 Tax=Rotaria magnacalcarata TaxID=392030 RepID=A0A816R8M2_9BILA|nr:unnamed protein product [Rotaria magnacalcarata]CAF1512714.1 unnamed protein product [Rotaria magnacalcarata]CAF2070892.1 unnamed protein product [Rotaria magnacalcarata]CAF2071303.1 unnamed protein product [Rotaria magnacalcarata]CAF2100927.1 unnamed protein product [Rotaria magnacalcarata]